MPLPMAVHTTRPAVQRQLYHLARHLHESSVTHHCSHPHGCTDVLYVSDRIGVEGADLSAGVIIGECAIV
jgi:hypothetical protein